MPVTTDETQHELRAFFLQIKLYLKKKNKPSLYQVKSKNVFEEADPFHRKYFGKKVVFPLKGKCLYLREDEDCYCLHIYGHAKSTLE